MALNEKQLMAEYATEISDLLQGPARHLSALHTPENATADKGGMKYCPGCRLIILSHRLADMAKYQDDDKPQTRFKNKSRKEDALERLNARRDAEA